MRPRVVIGEVRASRLVLGQSGRISRQSGISLGEVLAKPDGGLCLEPHAMVEGALLDNQRALMIRHSNSRLLQSPAPPR
eukprot:3478581-Pyramimonas_sp.AAC.1